MEEIPACVQFLLQQEKVNPVLQSAKQPYYPYILTPVIIRIIRIAVHLTKRRVFRRTGGSHVFKIRKGTHTRASLYKGIR